jgi:hypothetical protein
LKQQGKPDQIGIAPQSVPICASGGNGALTWCASSDGTTSAWSGGECAAMSARSESRFSSRAAAAILASAAARPKLPNRSSRRVGEYRVWVGCQVAVDLDAGEGDKVEESAVLRRTASNDGDQPARKECGRRRRRIDRARARQAEPQEHTGHRAAGVHGTQNHRSARDAEPQERAGRREVARLGARRREAAHGGRGEVDSRFTAESPLEITGPW